MRVRGQHHVPAALPSGMTRYPFNRSLGGPQRGSGRVRKTRAPPPTGFDSRGVQPVESNYTDWVRGQLKCDGTRTETRFRLSAKQTSPFKSAGASVQSTAGNRGVRISGSNAGYTMFRGSVKGTGYPLHSPVSPSLPLPCVTVCHHISTGVYYWNINILWVGDRANCSLPQIITEHNDSRKFSNIGQILEGSLCCMSGRSRDLNDRIQW